MEILDVVDNGKSCCSCVHLLRTTYSNDLSYEFYNCEIDNHYIGYLKCGSEVCEKWEENNKRNVL